MKSKTMLMGIVLVLSGACAKVISPSDWLQQMAGEPLLKMGGIWDGGNKTGGGWGEGRFVQEGNRFWGSLGYYDVKGSINGQEVYMLLSSRNYIFYTVKLKYFKEGSLRGFAWKDFFGFDKMEGEPHFVMMLNKTSD